MLDRQLRIPFELTESQAGALCLAISNPRLGKYINAAGHDVTRALNLYRWNALIGECFHFPLQATEITLRNSINKALSKQFGRAWHESEDFVRILTPETQADLATSLRRLRNRLESFNPDDVVASMSFGFWSCLMEPRYFQPIWRHHLRLSFPHLPQGRAHKSVHLRVRGILNLRNRVAHHEPLIERDLSREHSEIVEFVSWMCLETAEWIKAQSFVQAALRQRP